MAATLATVALSVGLVAARARRERRPDEERLPRERRGFGLAPGESAAEGLRRIALGQLDDAIELLRGQAPGAPPPAEAVHETRKAIKRLRALVRLLEGELGAKRAARERAALREAAAQLAGARDAEVMVATLEGLLDREPRRLSRRRGVAELREQLEHERREATAQLADDAAARERVARELLAIRARVACWEMRERRTEELVGPGLMRIVRAGRRGRRRGTRRKADPRARHRWRKHVKDLRYALEALSVREPAGGGASATARGGGDAQSGRRQRRPDRARLAKLARRADRLGETLGEEHDLVLLRERVRTYGPLRRRRGRRGRKRLLRAIDRRCAKLRGRAERDGRRLYALAPKRFVRAARG